jgi:hypothetical protein
MRAILTIVITMLPEGASAHFSFIDIKSQIACNFYAKDGINRLLEPIMEGQPFSEWWMHGQVDCQSNATGSFALPANGRTHIVMSIRVQTVPPPYSTGSGYAPSNPDYVLQTKEWGSGPKSHGNTLRGHHNIHAYTRDDTSGCALAILYKHKTKNVLPKDFVIFSVIHDCPKRQREPINVPNLPACPNGNCICAWFCLPKTSRAKNFYMTPFVCHVTGANANASPVDVEYAIPPRRCLDPTNCNFYHDSPLIGSEQLINASTCPESYYSRQTTPFSMALVKAPNMTSLSTLTPVIMLLSKFLQSRCVMTRDRVLWNLQAGQIQHPLIVPALPKGS